MGIELTKCYYVICDDINCDIESDSDDTKAILLANIKESGWVKRTNKFYCPECSSKYPPLKRGRKPKPKQKVEAAPVEAKPLVPVWNGSESEIWSPGD